MKVSILLPNIQCTIENRKGIESNDITAAQADQTRHTHTWRELGYQECKPLVSLSTQVEILTKWSGKAYVWIHRSANFLFNQNYQGNM